MVREVVEYFKMLDGYRLVHYNPRTDKSNPYLLPMSIIGQNVKRLRRSRGLSQGKLARQASVSLNTVVKLELGGNDNPTLKTMQSLAQVLGTNLMGLLRKGR